MTRNQRIAQQRKEVSRRNFMWRGACAAMTTTALTNAINDLRLIRAATAAPPKRKQTTSSISPAVASDYKAMICIFLFGGNDGNNVLIPTDTNTYSQYTAARGVLAVPTVGQAGGALALNPLTSDGHTYGLHPAAPELANLFNTGKMAVLCNVGTLLAPLTRAQYLARSVATPPQLFSHNDQQLGWQTSLEDQPAKTGWGGRTADLLNSFNSSNNVSMNISVAGANTLETGNIINGYNVSTSGAIKLNIPTSGNGPAELAALKSLLALSHTNLYENTFAADMSTAINNADTVNNAIIPTALSSYWTTPFPTSSLGNQLKMIARMIQAAPTLGHQRQIFFASAGGFDLHSTEGSSTGSQATLLADLSKCMNAFYQATVQLGVSNGVTSYTASDFSRTFRVNSGDGADHGWGNHHIIMGGGVVGQKIYGTFPSLTLGAGNDVDSGTGANGRWIPTTSVDQYSATLAKWFGVSPGSISSIFPYVGRFATPDLGFMG